MQSSPSLAVRAALAVALFVGFYVLALGIAAVLLYYPYVTWVYDGRPRGILWIVGAVIILWSIFPRWDRFEAPGLRLMPEEYPELFKHITKVAESTGQKVPAEVYLTSEVNAWVSDRGGIMGLGSRRVMAVGWPLMVVLKVSQFNGVLAHEFGHFHGGDVKLGPWIYKTRSSIGRTIRNLSEYSYWLHLPFHYYGMAFLRITNGVSRRQEYAADALAASVVGPGPCIQGLKLSTAADHIFQSYWTYELVPVLECGYRPPLVEGFRRNLTAPDMKEFAKEAVAMTIREEYTDPYDTHPSLADRIDELRQLGKVSKPIKEPSAISLLGNAESWETAALLSTFTDKATVNGLKRISWQAVGPKVWLSIWENAAKVNARALSGLTFGSVPDVLSDLDRFAARVPALEDEEYSPEDRRENAANLLGMAMATKLAANGWNIDVLPGHPVKLEYQGTCVEVFEDLGKLRSGEISRETWKERYDAVGLINTLLAPDS